MLKARQLLLLPGLSSTYVSSTVLRPHLSTGCAILLQLPECLCFCSPPYLPTPDSLPIMPNPLSLG